jgi:protein phosphatase-4 regulatory subunit 3
MTQGMLFEPILDLVLETMPRDNLLNSACLEFFEHIKKENIKTIIQHLVENYREKLVKITYVDTFSNYIMRFDQTHGFAPNAEASLLDTEEDTPPKRAETGRGGRWHSGIKDLDDQEEEYYNTSDNEEDTAVKVSPSRLHANGASPASKPLVDYNSDEENDMETDISAGILGSDENTPPTSQPKDDSNGLSTPIDSLAQSPPEKLSEKRRREEEDDDELSKLSHPKRRNSNSSVASNTSSVLRKKRSFNNSPNGNAGGKGKIAISISSAIKTGGEGPGGGDSGS